MIRGMVLAYRERWCARVSKQAVVIVASVGACLGMLVLASPAMAGLQREFAVFSDCPVDAPGVTACVVSQTTSGEFHIGYKSVPINKTITLQGGLTQTSTQLVPAVDGNTLSKTELQLPGGLIGVEIYPPLTEVQTIAELVGPVNVNLTNFGNAKGAAVSLPLRVRLANPVLGGGCYIGSKFSPVSPQLTTGTTSPPWPGKPITGSVGSATKIADNKIVLISGASLVDNTFSVPGATGCGGFLSFLLDPGVDLISGVPARAGRNAAILNSDFESAEARLVKAQAALPAVGKCEKLGTETGGYTDAGCVEGTPAKDGKFEWVEGPGPEPKFTVSSKAVLLETVNGAQVRCTESTGNGEYTGAKTVTMALALTGCKLQSSKEACQSAGAEAGEIVIGSLEGKLGFINDKVEGEELAASVGLELRHEPTFLAAQCGAANEALAVTGAVIGEITPTDKMANAQKLTFSEAEGQQLPQQFEGGPKDTLTAAFGAGPGEEAGLKAKAAITSEESEMETKEKLEVKARAN